MVFVGYHASHEQCPPSALLAAVPAAEQAGFDGAMCSDHIAPWGLSQGQAGHAWSWLGAALASASFPLGTVCAPGQRYHPAVIAQAIGTLAEMFPGRFWCALGSGEAVNEHITGDPWPPKPHRVQRLDESADVMRRLLAGERVSHSGAVRVDAARVWSRPAEPPPLRAAAVSAETAAHVARWADGMITVGHDPAHVARVIGAYRDAGGRGAVAVQVHVSVAATRREALEIAADQWRQATVPAELMWELAEPEDFDRRADPADESALRASVLITDDPADVTAGVDALADAGADEVYLHGVGKDQAAFIALARDEILPGVSDRP